MTLPLVREPRERAFAALPVVFGIHQLLEGAIWLRLDDGRPTSIHDPVVAAWLFVAWVLLPVGVPLAVARFEPDRGRRRLMHLLAVLGAAVAAYLVVVGEAGPSTVWIDQHHLVYGLPGGAGLVAVPYLVATCGSLLASSRRFAVVFGLVLGASAAVTLAVAAMAFTSVWCFFAAVMSLGLFAHYVTNDDPGSASASVRLTRSG